MKNLDDYGMRMCRYQAELFARSREDVSCSSPVFLRRFMYSDLARRMDGDGFLMEAVDKEDAFGEIEQEFGESSYGKIKFNREELYWIGYIYRYWCYVHEITSKRVYRIIKPDELKALYYPYHSLDPAQAIERIMEAKQIREEDYTERGVKILRELRKKKERSGL